MRKGECRGRKKRKRRERKGKEEARGGRRDEKEKGRVCQVGEGNRKRESVKKREIRK